MGYTQHTNHFGLNTDQGEAFNVLWYLKKQGYSDHTINFVRKALNRIRSGFTKPFQEAGYKLPQMGTWIAKYYAKMEW